MTDKDFTGLVLTVLILAIVYGVSIAWDHSKINQTDATLNTYLKTQKTLIGSNGDAFEYTYQQVGKTCYEDVRNGQVIESHCH